MGVSIKDGVAKGMPNPLRHIFNIYYLKRESNAQAKNKKQCKEKIPDYRVW